MKTQTDNSFQHQNATCDNAVLSSRLLRFQYGFNSVNGIVKKVYNLSEIPFMHDKCDVWQILPVVYVRQYTGLKDKNGQEVFEGDILKFITNGFDAETFITSIIFDKCSLKLKNDRALFYFGQSDFTKIDDGVVIGNIFENPEFL